MEKLSISHDEINIYLKNTENNASFFLINSFDKNLRISK